MRRSSGNVPPCCRAKAAAASSKVQRRVSAPAGPSAASSTKPSRLAELRRAVASQDPLRKRDSSPLKPGSPSIAPSEQLVADLMGLEALEHNAVALAWERLALEKQLDVLSHQLHPSKSLALHAQGAISQGPELATMPPRIPEEKCEADSCSDDDASTEVPSDSDGHSDGLWQLRERILLSESKPSTSLLTLRLEQARFLHKQSVAAESRALQFSAHINGKLDSLHEHERRSR